MSRFHVLAVLAVLAALAAAPGALAKGELQEGAVAVCGPTGCGPLEDDGALRWLTRFMYAEDPGPTSEAPAAAYYELRFGDPSAAETLGYFVPSSGTALVRRFNGGAGGWYRLARGVPEALRDAAGGLSPFPAPALATVYLDDRTAPDPAPYLGLFSANEPLPEPPTDAPRLTVTLVSAKPTPWTGESSLRELPYVPSLDAVRLDEGWVRVPAPLAALIERDAGLRPTQPPAEARQAPPAAEGAGFPWPTLGAALGAGLLALVAAAVVRRRRGPGRRGSPQAV
jgi:hypothetical protein